MKSDRELMMTTYDVDRLFQEGRLQEALDLALNAIRSGQWEKELFYIAAKTAFRLGHLKKAGQLINKFLALDPEHINGWLLYGEIHARKNDSARAAYGNQRAVDLFPAISRFQILSDGGQATSSQGDMGKTVESPGDDCGQKMAPPEARCHFNTLTFAEICESQGYLNKALAIYNELSKKDPQNGEILRRIQKLKKKLRRDDSSKN